MPQQFVKGVATPHNEANVDHAIRKFEGGRGNLDNAQLLCWLRNVVLKKGGCMDKEKICLLYESSEGILAKEFLWAAKIGQDWRVENIPFFAKNIAFNDIVSVEVADGELYFDKIVSESGNSTIQISILDEASVINVISEIEKARCQWEGYGDKNLYLAVNVSDEISYSKVRDYLYKATAGGILDFQEACLSSRHRK